MAIISKSQEGGPAGLWTRIIRVDSDGNFSSNLPTIVSENLGYASVEGKTKTEVEDKVQEALKLYDGSTTKRRKVILFNVESRYRISGDREGGPFTLDSSEGDFCLRERLGTYLGLSVGVFEELARITGAGTRYEYTFVKSSLDPFATPRDLRPNRGDSLPAGLLPWTQALEDYFLRTVKAMAVLAQALKGLSTPEKVLALVAKSPCALPYPQPEIVDARNQ